MKIRKNDTVEIMAGRDKGKRGKVRFSHPKDQRLLVEGINFVKRHARATGQARQAGIIEREEPIHVSDVMLVCSKCGRPSRVGYRTLADGKKVRMCHSCKEVID